MVTPFFGHERFLLAAELSISPCPCKGEMVVKKIMSGILAVAVASVLTANAGQAREWVGKASYYDLKGRTASGARVGAFTAAHRTLPMGSRVRVTNLRNHRSVVVTVNDRGPFTHGRVIDVSASAAESLGFKSAGVAPVKVETVSD